MREEVEWGRVLGRVEEWREERVVDEVVVVVERRRGWVGFVDVVGGVEREIGLEDGRDDGRDGGVDWGLIGADVVAGVVEERSFVWEGIGGLGGMEAGGEGFLGGSDGGMAVEFGGGLIEGKVGGGALLVRSMCFGFEIEVTLSLDMSGSGGKVSPNSLSDFVDESCRSRLYLAVGLVAMVAR